MIDFQTIRSVLVAILVIGAVSAVGPHATYSQFSDEHDGNAGLTASSNFNTNPGNGGGGNEAFNDRNGNGVRDSGEETYNANELRNFDDPDANLVIPSGVDEISANGWKELSITAASIESYVDLSTQKANITLNALNGDVRVRDSTITVEQETGSINLYASDDVLASGANIQTNSGNVIVDSGGAVDIDDATIHVQNNYPRISVTGNSISAQQADFDTESGPISLTATAGGIEATDADLQVASNSGQITLSATNDIVGDGGTFQTDSGNIQVETTGVVNIANSAVTVSSGYSGISVTGNSISAQQANLDTDSGPISLTGLTGGIEATDAVLQITSGYGNVTITGQSISAMDADIDTQNGAINVFATVNGGGKLDATGATMTVNQGWGSLALHSNGDLHLNMSTLRTANAAATADLSVSSASLYVDEMTIQDDDTTLEYDPDGVTVVGTPNGGASP